MTAGRMAAEFAWERIVIRWRDLYDSVWKRSVVAPSDSRVALG
jgi:hypothetical protein